ncbi:hypothetical protein J2793_006187 [Paraburkholderia caledonica]|uniref:Uncharacterized protein n=1 Tax=Paraburkholderia caledonica TaxID=134536 RepID=A0AB73IL30_9BURK|nr:hypothetical protein [Paraburkholderia caledonica]
MNAHAYGMPESGSKTHAASQKTAARNSYIGLKWLM